MRTGGGYGWIRADNPPKQGGFLDRFRQWAPPKKEVPFLRMQWPDASGQKQNGDRHRNCFIALRRDAAPRVTFPAGNGIRLFFGQPLKFFAAETIIENNPFASSCVA
jgi:hypothetical protein